MPNNWNKYILGDLIDVKHGYAFKGEFFSETPTKDILLSPGNFNIGGGFKADKFKYYNGSIPQDYILNEGDLLITMTDLSPKGDTLGTTALIPKHNGINYLHNQRLGLVILKSNQISKNYLYWALRSDNYHNFIVASATGSTVRHTSPSRIKEYEIEIPDLKEQQAIAEILSSLDDKIELNLQINKTLEEMANALYKHWFVDFGPFLPSGRCPQDGRGPIPGFIESDPDSYREGLIPEGWEVKELRELVTVINGYAFKGTDFIDEGVPVLKIKNVKAGKVIFNELAYVSKEVSEKAVKAKIYFQDILITMTGNRMDGTPETWVGKSAMFLKETGDYFLNQRVSKIKIKEGKPFSNYYLSIMLASEYFQNYFISNSTSSGGQANISPDLIYNIKTVCPSIETLNSFDEIVSKWIMLKCNNENEIETLKQTRDYLLPKLISGEIRVKDAVKLSKSVL